jgi:hypothetical protein
MAIADKFGGNVDKWVFDFAFFCQHVHGLVYPGLIGLEGICFYVDMLPSFVRSMHRTTIQARGQINNGNSEATII